MTTPAETSYSGKLKATIMLELEANANANDIYNWLQKCDDPKTLRYLGNAALNAAKRLESPLDDDDFRSRA